MTVIEVFLEREGEKIMFGFLEQWAEEQVAALAEKRLVIPAADLQGVADATAQYTADGQPLTTEQVAAADKAIIAYALHRALGNALGKL